MHGTFRWQGPLSRPHYDARSAEMRSREERPPSRRVHGVSDEQGVKTSPTRGTFRPSSSMHGEVQEVAPKTAGTRDIVGGLLGPFRVSCSLPLRRFVSVDDADRDVTGLPSFAAAVTPCWEDGC
jgi:hypothetical protein